MPQETTPHLYRVVFAGDSSLRLMEKAADTPARWRFPYASQAVQLVTVRDLVQSEQGVPRHLGHEYTVEVEGTDIDAVADEAHRYAESVAMSLAAARRAPVGRVVLQLAYDITPGIEERAFRQWFWDLPIPIAKPSVDQAVFGELWARIDTLANDATATRTLWRTVASLSWFRQALEETDAIFRFHKLWVAVEALNPLLDEHYGVPPDARSGFQGLRRLAEETGFGGDWVSRPLGLRRQLYHAVSARPHDLRRKADTLMPDLEALCVSGWRLLLDIDAAFPADSVIPHPLYVRLDGVLLHKDHTAWDAGPHPHLEAKINLERVPASDPRDVTFRMSTTYTVRNTDQFRGTGQGMWGPTGYQALTWTETA